MFTNINRGSDLITVQFLDELDLRTVSGDAEWVLLSDFRALILHGDDAQQITVPMGFVTDLASVPRLPGLFLLFGGRARKPAVIHDWLYQQQTTDREYADAVFFAAMATDQNWFTRTFMWLGVRVGGWAVWERRKVPVLPLVEETNHD